MKNRLYILTILLALIFIQCENETEIGVELGSIDFGHADGFKISGTVYDWDSNVVLPGAIINIGVPNDGDVIVADKNGHYEITGLKSWYTEKEAVAEGQSIAWSYNIDFLHQPENFLTDQVEPGLYLETQNDYAHASYQPLVYLDLENQTEVNHVTQNLYLQKINKDIVVTATLFWDDSTIIQKSQLLAIRLNPHKTSPKDGRIGYYGPEKFEYNESTGLLKIGGYFATGRYKKLTLELDAGVKKIWHSNEDKQAYIDSAYTEDSIYVNKNRRVYVNLSGADSLESMYLHYAICSDKNFEEHIHKQKSVQIVNGSVTEKHESDNDDHYEPVIPGKTYYFKAFVDSTNYDDSFTYMSDTAMYKYGTDFVPFEIKFEDWDSYYTVNLEDFKLSSQPKKTE